MKILRSNLEWIAATALRVVKSDDSKRGGPNFKSGHQQQLEAILQALQSSEPITVE